MRLIFLLDFFFLPSLAEWSESLEEYVLHAEESEYVDDEEDEPFFFFFLMLDDGFRAA